MTIQGVLNKTIFTGFSSADEAIIRQSMTNLYNRSATARAMLDKITLSQLVINFVPGKLEAWGFFELAIDLSEISRRSYITPNGKGVTMTLDAVLAHELVHAIEGLVDNPQAPNFAGDTVIFANKIYNEMGIPQRLSYLGAGYYYTVSNGKEYTNGAVIDTAMYCPMIL